MTPSFPITQTSIFQLKEGISLADTTSKIASPAVKAFIQLKETVKAQKGFIRQYWGHQVENSQLFVWYIDWESPEHHENFTESEGYSAYTTSLGEIFYFEKALPLTNSSFVVYTKWSSDATAALKAPVTEIAFLTLPNGSPEEAKAATEEALGHVMTNVQAVGKAWGASIGWVSKTTPSDHKAAAEGHHIALHGVFGYASIDDHMRWREAPEHAKAVETMEELATKLHLDSADIYGTDMFHVAFYHPKS
ncbi:hypothetical protein F5890DRAFT_1515551 [Lentinula detonsa]|uniref:ABM domain-containing protein n=1 Tax=Lentinula detonsa TaxID=2804962 RepID=A0AA38UTJ0_9AGAR|nr:hypothetical protein F5890DRAFT_1515551 [Lentinula detonsa]